MQMVPWEALITGIRTWSRGTERAIHKPILTLMILSTAEKNGPNLFRFREIEAPLQEALEKFGSSRSRPKPEHPFWYLKNDGFWVVHHEARLTTLKRGREPSRRLLLDEDATAEVPLHLWGPLLEQPDLRVQLIEKVIAHHLSAVERRALLAHFFPTHLVHKPGSAAT